MRRYPSADRPAFLRNISTVGSPTSTVTLTLRVRRTNCCGGGRKSSMISNSICSSVYFVCLFISIFFLFPVGGGNDSCPPASQRKTHRFGSSALPFHTTI